MKKIMVIIVCAGVSVGLLIGGVGNTGRSGLNKAVATQTSKTATTCTITPCSLDEIITNRILSVSLNGVEANHKLITLQSELSALMAELPKMEKGTKEYSETISRIHYIFGKVSVLLGEMNSQVDIETQILFEVSEDNADRLQADYVQEILYEAETE